MPAELTSKTLVLDYNDPQRVADAFAKYGDDIAAVVLEPVAGNMNFVRPSREFIDTLRVLCTRHGSVLIFDEVMTGFRVGRQWAQGVFGVQPDLTTLGKVIGGGLPVGAFGGRRDIMSRLAPLGPVYQAGTLSGNPVAVTAGLATLKRVLKPGFFELACQKPLRDARWAGVRYLVAGYGKRQHRRRHLHRPEHPWLLIPYHERQLHRP